MANQVSKRQNISMTGKDDFIPLRVSMPYFHGRSEMENKVYAIWLCVEGKALKPFDSEEENLET